MHALKRQTEASQLVKLAQSSEQLPDLRRLRHIWNIFRVPLASLCDLNRPFLAAVMGARFPGSANEEVRASDLQDIYGASCLCAVGAHLLGPVKPLTSSC